MRNNGHTESFNEKFRDRSLNQHGFFPCMMPAEQAKLGGEIITSGDRTVHWVS